MEAEPALVHQDQVAHVTDHDRGDTSEDFGEEPSDRRDPARRELREIQPRQDTDGSSDHEHTEAQRQRAEDGVLQAQLGA